MRFERGSNEVRRPGFQVGLKGVYARERLLSLFGKRETRTVRCNERLDQCLRQASKNPSCYK